VRLLSGRNWLETPIRFDARFLDRDRS